MITLNKVVVVISFSATNATLSSLLKLNDISFNIFLPSIVTLTFSTCKRSLPISRSGLNPTNG